MFAPALSLRQWCESWEKGRFFELFPKRSLHRDEPGGGVSSLTATVKPFRRGLLWFKSLSSYGGIGMVLIVPSIIYRLVGELRNADLKLDFYAFLMDVIYVRVQ